MRCCITGFKVREPTEAVHRANLVMRHPAHHIVGNYYRSKDKNKSHGPKNRKHDRASPYDTSVCGPLAMVRLRVHLSTQANTSRFFEKLVGRFSCVLVVNSR